MTKAAGKSIRIEYFRSAIGRSWRQKLIVKGLGFTKLRQVVERPDNAGVRGMVLKIPHLVRIIAVDAKTKIHGQQAHPAKATKASESKTHETKAHETKAHEVKAHESKAHDVKPHETKAHESKTRGTAAQPAKSHASKAPAKTGEKSS